MSNNNQVDTFQIENDAIGTLEIQDLSLTDADISNTADISQSKILNLTTDLASKLNEAGGTMTGPLFGVDPVNNLDAVTKQYVDSRFQSVGTSSSVLLSKKPNISSFNDGSQSVVVTPFRLLSEHQIIESTTNQTFILNNTNLESGSVVWGNLYYLYLTTSSLKFSSTPPTTSKKHPTNNWTYLSFIKTRSGTNDIAPFVKTDDQFRYLNTSVLMSFSSSTPNTNGNYNLDCSLLAPPHARIVHLGWHGDTTSAYVPLQITVYGDGPSRSSIVDQKILSGYPGAGGGNNQGQSGDGTLYGILYNQILYISIGYSGTTQQLWFEGFLD